MAKKIIEVSIEQLPALLIDQAPARFAMWTREEDGDWTIVKEDFRTVEELGRYLHDLQVKNDHAIVIREHGHKSGMKPLQQLLEESGVLRCHCDIPPKRRHK